MIWPVFLAAVWLALGLDVGLRDALQFGSGAAPSLTLILVAYVALWAPKIHVIYAALVAGAALDLMGAKTAPGATEAVTTLGPTALGAALGAFTVQTARAMMERHNPLALPVMSVVLVALTHLVAVFCLSVRGAYDPALAFEAGPELVSRGVSALYTGVAAVPIGLMLMPISRVFGFQSHQGRWARRH